MRRFHIYVVIVALGWVASNAVGQGLYGAPEMLPLTPESPPPTYQGYAPPPNGYPPAPVGYGLQPGYPQTQYSQIQPPAYNQTQPSAPVQYAQQQYPQYPQYPQYAPAQYLPRGPQGLPPTTSRAVPPGHASPQPGRGYYGNPAQRYPYRVAAASAPGVAPAPSAPHPQALAPMPQPVPEPPPRGYGDSYYNDSGYGPNGASCGTGNQFFDAVCGFNCDPYYQPKWYATAYGLFLTRDRANGVFTTFDPDTGDRLMRTSDAAVDWRGGYDVKVGARFGAENNWAIEGGYWTIDRFRGSATAPGAVNTPLIVDGIEFDVDNGDRFFNASAAHRVSRTDRLQSAEVSLVYRSGNADPCCISPLDFGLMAGARYVVFQDELTFGALAAGGSWGGSGGINEAYFNDRIANNLIGFQFGADAGFRVARTFRLFVTPKLGLYNNHIQNRFDAFRGDGTPGTTTLPTGRLCSVSVNQDVFAVLAQADAGLNWEFAPHWMATIGYRLVAATGMGLADHQFPNNVVDFAFLDTVKSNGNLLVHGAFAGLQIEF